MLAYAAEHVLALFVAAAAGFGVWSWLVSTKAPVSWLRAAAAREPSILSVGGQRPSVAACLIGLPSGVNGSAAAFRKFVGHVLQPDIFIMSPGISGALLQSFQPRAVDAEHVQAKVYLESLANNRTNTSSWRSLLRIGGSWAGPVNGVPRSGALLMIYLRRCHELIRKAERADGQNYSSIFVARLDLMWLAPHPCIDTSEQPGCHIPCEGNDFGGYCDHMAFCDREGARVYMLDRTAPFLDVEYRSRFIIEFNETSHRNPEQHIKYVLGRKEVPIHRYVAPAFRACSSPKGHVHKCAWTNRFQLWYKTSGSDFRKAYHIWKQRGKAEGQRGVACVRRRG